MGAARLFASAATRSAIEGSSFGRAVEAGLPDVIGQVVGQAFVGAVAGGRRSNGNQTPEQVADAAAASTGGADQIEQSLVGLQVNPSNFNLTVTGEDLANSLEFSSRVDAARLSGLSKEQALRQVFVEDLAADATAAASDGPSYRSISLRDGIEDKVVLTDAGYAATHTELRIRRANLAAEFVIGNIDSNQFLSATDSINRNEALIDEWYAIADREVINVISTVYSGVDMARGAYRIAANGEHTIENYASAGGGLVGGAITPALKSVGRYIPKSGAAERGVVSGVDASTLARSHTISGRASSRNVNQIADSMRSQGYVGDAIEVIESNGKMIIVDGHHRAAAARRTRTPVDVRVVGPETFPRGPGGWQSIDEVIEASAGLGPDRLRPPGR